MIVDRIMSVTDPIEIGQTDRQTTTFRIMATRALLGTVAAMSLTHVVAENTNVPFVGVDVYNPSEFDFDYTFQAVEVTDVNFRHSEVIEETPAPDLIDQFVFEGTSRGFLIGINIHSEYFLIDPNTYEVDLGFGSYADSQVTDAPGNQGTVFFTLNYTDSTKIERGNNVMNMVGSLDPEPLVTNYMDFQYSVETLDALDAYREELGLESLSELQSLTVPGRNQEARSRIIEILTDQYPEMAKETLIITRYSDVPADNAPRLNTAKQEEASCVVESIGVTRHSLYGAKDRNANFMVTALSGALMGGLLGMRRKKVRRDPPHMEAPDEDTVSKVLNGNAGITDKVKVAYWQNYLNKTKLNQEQLRTSKSKARKAGFALIAACSGVASMPAIIQRFTSEETPKEVINPENHPQNKAFNTNNACAPDQLVYYRYVVSENPDEEVEFVDPDENKSQK